MDFFGLAVFGEVPFAALPFLDDVPFEVVVDFDFAVFVLIPFVNFSI